MADAGEFIQIDDKTGTDSRYFCTCFANQTETQLHGGISSRSYLSGQLINDRVLSASADASQGKGFAAAAGDLTIQINDQTGSLLASIIDGSWRLIGGRVWIAYREPSGAMRQLYQLAVTDYASEDGTILVMCKTPSYLQSQLLHKSAAVSLLSTDPVDSANPVDPNYLEATSSSVSAGRAFGGVAVSLKAGETLPVCRAAYFTESVFRSGAIATPGAEAFVIYKAARRVTQHVYDSAGVIVSVGAVMFDCRGASATTPDNTERDRLKDEIDAFIAAGYRVILSTGDWFLDVTANTGGSWNIKTRTTGTLLQSTSGATWGTYVNTEGSGDVGIWFVLADADGNKLYPDDLDPSQIGLYFAPLSIPVASHQVVVDGFARDQKTIEIAAREAFAESVLRIAPLLSSESNFYSARPVRDLGFCFQLGSVGGIWGAGALSGSGSIDDIRTDPDDPFPGGTAPVTIQAVDSGSTGAQIAAALTIKSTINDPSVDFTCVESTWQAEVDAFGFAHPYSAMKVFGPFDILPDLDKTIASPTGGISTFSRTAKRSPLVPNWPTKATDVLAEINSTSSIAIQSDWAYRVTLRVYECFLYAYSAFSFSSIYSTVYPFWTRQSCHSLAYGNGVIVAGGVGRSTAVAANGAIAWAPITLPGNGIATITGTAYGVIGADTIWASVGWLTYGGVDTPTCWLSDDGGVTWSIDALYQTTSKPTQIRFFDGKFVATRSDGKIDVAPSVDPTFLRLDWTAITTGATQLNDIAYGAGRYIVVGNGGQAWYSSNLSTWTDWAYPVGDDLLCAVYSQSSIGGFFHVGCGLGTIYRKYDGSVLTWTFFGVPGGGAVVAISDCSGDVLAVSVGGTIFARSPGYADVDWKNHLALGAETGDKFGIITFSLSGVDHVVVGGPAQIATSNTFRQGASAAYYGIGIPDWTPWGTKTERLAMQFLQAQFMGGTADNWNPIQWQQLGSPSVDAFGLAVDPPSTSEGARSGKTALDAARQICQEWWIFAGDMAETYIDGNADSIEDPDQSDPTAIALGNIEDCFTQITAQYKPFGGEYLGKAYIQNVDTAYVAGNDAFYFAGWDDDSSGTNGRVIWNACRAAYLETGIIRDTAMNFDSVQSASSMGAALLMTDSYLGDRINWICRRPKYYTVTIDGNDSAAATAHVGSLYKVNPLFLDQRSLTLGGIFSTGLVVEESHNVTAGKHTLTLAFAP